MQRSICHAHRLERGSIAARVSWNGMQFVSTPGRQGIVHRSIHHHHHVLVTSAVLELSILWLSALKSHQMPMLPFLGVPYTGISHPNERSNLISTQIIHPSLQSDIHHRGLAVVVKPNEGQCHVVSLQSDNWCDTPCCPKILHPGFKRPDREIGARQIGQNAYMLLFVPCSQCRS